MAILLALLSALAYGISDFCGGLASRRLSAAPVAAAVLAISVLTAGTGVLLVSGQGPDGRVLLYGGLSGVGGGAGSLALYHGMAHGRMTVVVTLSAVLTAVVPALAGVAMGQRLAFLAVIGIVAAVPAIALVSWAPGGPAEAAQTTGALWGLLAGLGFAGAFIALDHAGTRSGAWPTLAGQSVAWVLVLPFALAGWVRERRPLRRSGAGLLGLILATGVISGAANLLFLAASGRGALAIVAVLSALYPAVTVLLARFILAERTTLSQSLGLVVALAAVVLVSVA